MSIQRDVEQHLAANSFFSMMFRNGARSATLKSVKTRRERRLIELMHPRGGVETI
jgi:hypothetical protein